MRRAALRVGDEPLQWLGQGGILTLTHAENPSQDQSAARNWRRTVERAGFRLIDVVPASPEALAIDVAPEVCRYRWDVPQLSA